MLIFILIEIIHILSGDFLMLAQIVVRAVGNPPQLGPAKGEAVFDVTGSSAVVRKLLR